LAQNLTHKNHSVAERTTMGCCKSKPNKAQLEQEARADAARRERQRAAQEKAAAAQSQSRGGQQGQQGSRAATKTCVRLIDIQQKKNLNCLGF
jgi:hypothetical protein